MGAERGYSQPVVDHGGHSQLFADHSPRFCSGEQIAAYLHNTQSASDAHLFEVERRVGCHTLRKLQHEVKIQTTADFLCKTHV